MRIYTAITVQMMIWSAFTLIEWLSKHDKPAYNYVMFAIFFYLALLAARQFLDSARKVAFATVSSLIIYFLFYWMMSPFV
ncbi:hypothetical protein [Bacillus massilinigeriensis]|uniref:hypothetical protein n=1 Tax=Bacillus mediterraneensis TaxID=1805474 RepID=UPI0008F84D33|nr:hypothetical protein [Bacillus mediterraneensis]